MDVYERLYNNAMKPKRRISHDDSSFEVNKTRWSNQSMKKFENYEIELRERRKREIETINQEKRESEEWTCPLCMFKNIYRYKYCHNVMKGGKRYLTIDNIELEIGQEKDYILVDNLNKKENKLYNSAKNKVNQVCGYKRTTDRFRPELLNKNIEFEGVRDEISDHLYVQHQLQRDRLKIMKYKQDNLQVAECTFKPKIIRKKSTGSKNDDENVYEHLYSLSKSKPVEVDDSENQERKAFRHPRTMESMKEFCNRLYTEGNIADKKIEKLRNEQLYDTENGKKTKLFSPTINQRSKSSINRRKPVYEELYELSQKQGKEVIEDVSEESTEILRGKQTSDEIILHNRNSAKLSIYRILTGQTEDEFTTETYFTINRDSFKNDFSMFQPTLQNLINKFLVRFFNDSFNFSDFEKYFSQFIKHYNGNETADLFIKYSPKKIERYTKSKKDDIQESTFHPKINERSVELSKSTRLDIPIYEALIERGRISENQKMVDKAEIQKEILKECTFNPIKVNKY